MHPEALSTTRTALHAVAESILAGHQYRTTGTIRLHVVPGGFSTGPLSGDLRRLGVRGQELVVDGAAGTSSVALDGLSLAEIAAAAGVSSAAPEEVYRSSTPSAGEFRVELDPASVQVVHAALAVGDDALRRLAAQWDEPLGEPVLWPEHFDVSCSVTGATLGVSPGDQYIDGPYAYVVPDNPHEGAFWNQPFGAAQPLAGSADPDSVLRFFVDGLHRALE